MRNGKVFKSVLSYKLREIPGDIFQKNRTALSTTGSQGGLQEIQRDFFHEKETALSTPGSRGGLQ